MQVERYNELITKHLTSSGFKKEESSTSDFDTAFVGKLLGARIIFLVKDIGELSGGDDYILNIRNLGRNWCINNGMAIPFFRWGNLNFILLHRGQLLREHIQRKIDLTNLHKSIILSITAIDTSRNKVMQERRKALLGKFRKLLDDLKKISVFV